MSVTQQSLPLDAGTWRPDPAHSTVEFVVRHLGLSKVRGRFHGVDATVVVGDELATTSVEATIDLATVDTGNEDRDAHLRSADFFAADAGASMSFRSTAIEPRADDELALTGDLTVNGVTLPVVLDVELTGVAEGPGGTHAGFSATTTLSRKAFGITFDVPMKGDAVLIADKVLVEIELQLLAA